MSSQEEAGIDNVAAEARRLIRSSRQIALATLQTDTGEPYVSLAMTACDLDATPLLLLSTLAVHTGNIGNDARVSLLYDGTEGLAMPLAGRRLSVQGEAHVSAQPRHRARYLAQHPKARSFADFTDFDIYEVKVTRAHLVAGFAKVSWLQGAEIILDDSPGADTENWESELVACLNEDCRAEIEQLGERRGGAAGAWRLAACDVEGCDLGRGDDRVRLDFRQRAGTPAEVEATLRGLFRGTD
jgi:putative heme iron utilization protein